jgi:hypothetical protein
MILLKYTILIRGKNIFIIVPAEIRTPYPQQLSAGAPAAQIFTQICLFFLLVGRGSTHVLHENINCLFACRANALCR